MNNREAFIDFCQGLLNINPLERWSPAQAKLHPFITQNKFTGKFIPPTSLKNNVGRSPAPGVQQQINAEAQFKQRAQAQAQAQAHAQAQAQTQYAQPHTPSYAPMPMNQFPQSPQVQPPLYSNNPYHANMSQPQAPAPPPYTGQTMPTYGTQIPMAQAQQGFNQQSNAYLTAQSAQRTGRQRSSTMEYQQAGIPAAFQRVASYLDPNAPIRLQPSPAYYPPPPDGGEGSSGQRRGNRARPIGQGRGNVPNRDFIRNLEDRTLEEGGGFMNQPQWQ